MRDIQWVTLFHGVDGLVFSAMITEDALDIRDTPDEVEITNEQSQADEALQDQADPTLADLEGLIRLGLLIGYLYLIGRVPDIQRVFGYHGVEHKAINAMEQGDPLDIPHVRRASRVHTRCGTGFLLLVVVISIFVFALVGSPSLLLKIISRVALVPIVAAIAYELMRLGAANYRYRIVRWLFAPGLALQGLTTREPDDSMIECAIDALKRVMQRDKVRDNGREDSDPVLPPLVAL